MTAEKKGSEKKNNEAGKREVLEFKDSITENENVSFFEPEVLSFSDEVRRRKKKALGKSW